MMLKDFRGSYEPQQNADQPMTNNSQSQMLQSSHHPGPDNAIPWSYYPSPSPGLMITSSQYATPRLSPRSTVSPSPSTHWDPSPGLMITTSQAASPSFLPHNAHTPSSNGRSSRLRFSHNPPAHRSLQTSPPPQRHIIPLLILPELAADCTHPGDLQCRSRRTISSLSRETLAEIFMHYADNLLSSSGSLDLVRRSNSARDRQETLLLVSRYWYAVATQTPCLWERFYIQIHHFSDFEIWKRLARRRYTRLKKDPRIFISINIHTLHYEPDRNMVPDQKVRRTIACLSGLAGLVAKLAGGGSALASSWKSFSIRFSPGLWLDDQLSDRIHSNAARYLGEILGREMSNIEHLELQGIHWLPPRKWTPASSLPQTFHRNMKHLRTIRLVDCIIPRTPDMRHAQELCFNRCTFWNVEPFGLSMSILMTQAYGASHALTRKFGREPLTHLRGVHKLAIGPLRTTATLAAASLRVLEVTYDTEHTLLSSLFYISGIIAGSVERLHFVEISRPGRTFDTFPGKSNLEEIKRSIISFFGSHRQMKEIQGPDELQILVLTALYELRLSLAEKDALFDGLVLKWVPVSTPKSVRITGYEDPAAFQRIARQYFNRTLPCWLPDFS